MPIASRSTVVRALPIGIDQRNSDAADGYGWSAGGPKADAGGQESQLAERRGLGNNLAERRVESTWFGKATGRDTVNATISMCTDFLVGTGSPDEFLKNLEHGWARERFFCHHEDPRRPLASSAMS